MPVRIRLQRHGKKGKPFYWIVAADSRASRDGKYLEKLGTYNPNTNPAQIDLNADSSLQWLKNGAQPSETARRILSYKGVLLKFHLWGGIAKGAITEEQAEARFQEWLEAKTQKIETKKTTLAQTKAQAKAKALKAEQEASDKRKAATENEPAEAPSAEAPAQEEMAPENIATEPTGENTQV
jgi:small subunit ribosomal protein S16